MFIDDGFGSLDDNTREKASRIDWHKKQIKKETYQICDKSLFVSFFKTENYLGLNTFFGKNHRIIFIFWFKSCLDRELHK